MDDERVALITGAGSGIGAATARAFARAGFGVLIGDVAGERIAEVEKTVRADGGRALGVIVDVRDSGSVDAMIAAGVAEFGGFDAVCPNAGIFRPETPLQETADDAIEALLDVNLKGVIYTLRAALPQVRDGGAVVVTSSVSGLQAHPNAAVYAATKIALLGLARSLALEVAGRRIRVNAVCPGGVDTPLTRGAYGGDATTVIAQYRAANPLGRMATPEDIADAITFLASPAARHINGVALRVDGGDCLLGAL